MLYIYFTKKYITFQTKNKLSKQTSLGHLRSSSPNPLFKSLQIQWDLLPHPHFLYIFNSLSKQLEPISTLQILLCFKHLLQTNNHTITTTHLKYLSTWSHLNLPLFVGPAGSCQPQPPATYDARQLVPRAIELVVFQLLGTTPSQGLARVNIVRGELGESPTADAPSDKITDTLITSLSDYG